MINIKDAYYGVVYHYFPLSTLIMFAIEIRIDKIEIAIAIMGKTSIAFIFPVNKFDPMAIWPPKALRTLMNDGTIPDKLLFLYT